MLCVSLFKRTVMRGLLTTALLSTLTSVAWSDDGADREDVTPLVQIGKEDGSSAEAARSGFRDVDEFRWTAEQPPDASDFPFGHFVEGVVTIRGVARVVVEFDLVRSYERVVLRLAREGSETTVVHVDQQADHQVSGEMLGSRDGNHFGSYDLALGPLQQGRHMLVLTVLDDGKGPGYAWDALKLSAR